ANRNVASTGDLFFAAINSGCVSSLFTKFTFAAASAGMTLPRINIINHGEDVAQIDAFVAKTRLDRVKDKDYININLTYELDKLTKGNQQLG
ncbi:hypothetical protein PUR50_33405, partial [Enterobacter hormaechei subsp. steigerwaltii]|nr:hypothetical protein [Enterobacter hormaechei subsp. steigerwaltii]